MSDRKKILSVATDPQFFQELDPVLCRGVLHSNWVPSGRASLMLARAQKYDLIVTEYPLSDISFDSYLAGIRKPESKSSPTPLLVVSDPEASHGLMHLPESALVTTHIRGRDTSPIQDFVADALRVSKRISARLMVQIEAILESREFKRACQSYDLSEAGMLLRTSARLAVGSDLSLTFCLPGDRKPILTSGQVVRHTDPIYEPIVGMGIHFVKLPISDADRIKRFVHSQLETQAS